MPATRLTSRDSTEAIRRLAEALAELPPPARAARLAAATAREVARLDSAAIYVIRGVGGGVSVAGRAGPAPPGGVATAHRSLAERCVTTGRPQGDRTAALAAMPITVAGRTVGALLAAGSPQAGALPLLGLIAAQAGPVLARPPDSGEPGGRASAFEALHEVAVTAGTIRDPRQLARLSVEKARELLGVDSAAMRWWDPEARVLRLLAGTDAQWRSRPATVPAGRGVIGAAFKRQRLVIEQDYPTAPNVLPESRAAGTRSAMAVPLRVHDRCVGALSVNHYSPRPFTEHEGQILAMLAAQVAPAIEAAMLAEQETQRAHTLSSLYEVAAAANGVLDQSLLARLVADKARALLDADSAALAVWDEAAGVLRVVADTRPGVGGTRARGEGCLGLAFDRREAFAVDDYAAWEHRIDWPEGQGVRSALGVPLLVESGALGALGISCAQARHFEPKEITLLSLLAAQVAPALQAARLFSELQSSQAQLSHVLSHAPVVLFALDRDGRITLAHGQAAILQGLPGSSNRGRSVFDLIDDSGLRTAFKRALEGAHAHALVQIRGADFDLRCSPLFDAMGRPDGVIAVAVDVSERRRAEEARRESEAKSRFLATMSHELRTPLNSVLGYSQLLSARTFGPLNERQARYLGHIESSGRHLLELIQDVLDISKIQAGHLTVSIENFELQPVLQSAGIKIQPLLAEKDLHLEIARAQGVRMRADRRRVEQVILNLLTNAVKFTPAGGRISLRAQPKQQRIELSVADTGPGIAPADRERIFEEFIQLDSGFARAQSGSGIGLALCRRLLELMDGTISVESSPGEGSVFKVDLPTAHQPSPRPARSRRALPVPDSV